MIHALDIDAGFLKIRVVPPLPAGGFWLSGRFSRSPTCQIADPGRPAGDRSREYGSVARSPQASEPWPPHCWKNRFPSRRSWPRLIKPLAFYKAHSTANNEGTTFGVRLCAFGGKSVRATSTRAGSTGPTGKASLIARITMAPIWRRFPIRNSLRRNGRIWDLAPHWQANATSTWTGGVTDRSQPNDATGVPSTTSDVTTLFPQTSTQITVPHIAATAVRRSSNRSRR
jgi:hypothetical protein